MPDNRHTAALRHVALAALTCIVLIFGLAATIQASEESTASSQESSTLPRPTDEPEIDRLRIQWYINRTFDAYTDALAESKPTVVFFTARQCGFCLTQLQRFRCPAIVRYAGSMNFGVAWRDEDEDGDQLAETLNVQRYPTVVILKSDEDRPNVIGRIEGVFPADDVDRVIQQAFRSYAEDEKKPMPDLLSVPETRRMLDQVEIAQPGQAFCAGGDG